MIKTYHEDFWQAIDKLVSISELIIDRPKGSAHPRFPQIVYPIDYGYLLDTRAMDGSGIDVWRGSLGTMTVNGIICTVDLMKKDSEIKILLACTEEEIKNVLDFHNDSEFMKGILVRRN